MTERELLNQKSAAARLGIAPNTLRAWGVAPAERRGREAMYDVAELEAIARRRRSGGADLTAALVELLTARAERVEHGEALAAAAVVPAAEAAEHWRRFRLFVRAHFLRAAPAIARRAARAQSLAEVEAALRDGLYRTMDAAARAIGTGAWYGGR